MGTPDYTYSAVHKENTCRDFLLFFQIGHFDYLFSPPFCGSSHTFHTSLGAH